jgi:hypothetical protein
MSGQRCFVLEEEKTLFSGTAALPPAMPGIDWIAPAQGFLRTQAEHMEPLLKPA